MSDKEYKSARVLIYNALGRVVAHVWVDRDGDEEVMGARICRVFARNPDIHLAAAKLVQLTNHARLVDFGYEGNPDFRYLIMGSVGGVVTALVETPTRSFNGYLWDYAETL